MSMEERKMLGTCVQPHQLPTVTSGLQTDSEPGQEQMSVNMILNLRLCEIKTGVEPQCGNLSDFLLESDNAKTLKVFRRKQSGFVETALDSNLSLVSNSKTGYVKKTKPTSFWCLTNQTAVGSYLNRQLCLSVPGKDFPGNRFYSETILTNFLENKSKLQERLPTWDNPIHAGKTASPPKEVVTILQGVTQRRQALDPTCNDTNHVKAERKRPLQTSRGTEFSPMPDSLGQLLHCLWCKAGSKTSDVAQQTEEINNAKEECLQ
ncbi:hypothetical protein E5288_WYG005787 [Bos mutus]|uniref:Uncharacterized protein n=1 Tax=Bos mutus TaxID=72004 RepID=A0A6B0R0W1_9CETA|nr:hypothetical protein [Bos mutus]